MRCSHCHNVVEDQDQYCTMCGTKIVRCPYCHGIVKEGSHYCLYCGKPINGQYNQYEPIHHNEEMIIDEGYKEKKKTNWIIVAVSIVLLVVSTSMAFNYLTKGPQVNVNPPAPQIEEQESNIEVKNELPFSTVTGNVLNSSRGYVTKDYVYITDESDRLVRMDHRLENHEMIIDEECLYIQVSDDKIYYVNKNQSLCVSDLDGKNRDIILDKDVYYVVYNNGYIYYQLDEDKESIYKYNIKTLEHTKLNDHQSYNINICGDVIYYTSTDGIYKMSIDGKNNERLLEVEAYNLIYEDNALYFVDRRSQVLRYDLNTKQSSVLTTNSSSYFNIINNIIFYIDMEGSLYRYDIKTKEKKRIYNGYVEELMVFDGCVVVYTSGYNDGYLVAIDFDGKNQFRLFIENDENFI